MKVSTLPPPVPPPPAIATLLFHFLSTGLAKKGELLGGDAINFGISLLPLFRRARERRVKEFSFSLRRGETTTRMGGGGRRGNKNRLSSTTCGEELQKIFKDWQSLNKRTLSKSTKKVTEFKRFAFLTFFDL